MTAYSSLLGTEFFSTSSYAAATLPCSPSPLTDASIRVSKGEMVSGPCSPDRTETLHKRYAFVFLNSSPIALHLALCLCFVRITHNISKKKIIHQHRHRGRITLPNNGMVSSEIEVSGGVALTFCSALLPMKKRKTHNTTIMTASSAEGMNGH